MNTSALSPAWTPRQIALAALLVLAVLLCWLPAFQSVADRYVDDGLQRSLLSFATARALHSVVSVLQGTELAVQPMGVGLTLTLGQVLAPISDLVAQFADWMLWASIAFGLQKLLLSMGGSYGVTGVLSLIALAWLLLRWRQQTVPTWLSRLLVVLLFTRLVMPVTIIGSDPDEHFDTIGGLIAHEIGHVPKRGELFELGGLQFVVLHTKGGAVRWFKVSKVEETGAAD